MELNINKYSDKIPRVAQQFDPDDDITDTTGFQPFLEQLKDYDDAGRMYREYMAQRYPNQVDDDLTIGPYRPDELQGLEYMEMTIKSLQDQMKKAVEMYEGMKREDAEAAKAVEAAKAEEKPTV